MNETPHYNSTHDSLRSKFVRVCPKVLLVAAVAIYPLPNLDPPPVPSQPGSLLLLAASLLLSLVFLGNHRPGPARLRTRLRTPLGLVTTLFLFITLCYHIVTICDVWSGPGGMGQVRPIVISWLLLVTGAGLYYFSVLIIDSPATMKWVVAAMGAGLFFYIIYVAGFTWSLLGSPQVRTVL
ncbi:MAG: hypothetical protein HQK56_16095, partial [Deltaproteobacteria bacterium]|nr:hypothetical protein [Deltaproteobacteria bacterium]